MTRRHKRAIFAVVSIAGVIAAIGFFRPAGHADSLTVPVKRADIEQSVLCTGTLQASKLVSVGAQVSGQLKHLAVKLGERVTAGQLLAEIDPVLQQNDLRDAEGSLEVAEANLRAKSVQLAQNRLELQRQQTMFAADASSKAEFDTAKAAVDTTEAEQAALAAQARKAASQLEKARANLGYTRIVAPMVGEVVAIVTRQGQTVVSQQTAPTILKLASLDTMTIKAQISEVDRERVRPGLPITFTTLGAPDKPLPGVLRAVEPAPESLATETATSTSNSSSTTAVYYNGLFDVQNADAKLHIGMTAQVSIVLSEAKNVLTVPTSALGERNKDGSYTVERRLADGRTEKRNIRAGLANSVNTQVTEGLEEGDSIVVRAAVMRLLPRGSKFLPF